MKRDFKIAILIIVIALIIANVLHFSFAFLSGCPA